MIQKYVADHYSLKISELKAKNNSKSIAVPRQIAMYLTKNLTGASLPEIGKEFGGKHHSTVIHSIRKVEDERRKDADFNSQINAMLAGLSADEVAKSVIAYEPIWAIGTGEVATPDDAQEVCGAIRVRIAELYDQGVADAVRIQYGGSVKSSNVRDIMAKPDVDGALVGGASLKADEFSKIVTFLK